MDPYRKRERQRVRNVIKFCASILTLMIVFVIFVKNSKHFEKSEVGGNLKNPKIENLVGSYDNEEKLGKIQSSDSDNAQSYKKCHMSDDRCLLETANFVLKHFHQGIPGINLGCFNPYFEERIILNKTSGIIKGDGVATNVSVNGFTNGKFLRFRGFDNNILEVDFSTPAFYGNFSLVFDATFVGIPVGTEGEAQTVFYDYFSSYKFELDRVRRNDSEYFKIINASVKFDFEDLTISMPAANVFLRTLLNTGTRMIKSHMTDMFKKIILTTSQNF